MIRLVVDLFIGMTQLFIRLAFHLGWLIGLMIAAGLRLVWRAVQRRRARQIPRSETSAALPVEAPTLPAIQESERSLPLRGGLRARPVFRPRPGQRRTS